MNDDIYRGIRIGRLEFVRKWRTFRSNPKRMAVLALFFLSISWVFYFTIKGAILFGGAVSNGSIPFQVTELLRRLLPISIGLAALQHAIHRLQQGTCVKPKKLLLTSVSTRATLLGGVLADTFVFLALGGPIALIHVLAFAYGVGSPVSAMVGLVAALPLFLLVPLLGFVSVLSAKFAVERVRLLLLLKAPLAGGLIVGVILLLQQLQAIIETERTVVAFLLARVPSATFFGWYADIFFIGTGAVSPTEPYWVLGFGVLVTIVVMSFFVGTMLASRVWRSTDQKQSSIVMKTFTNTKLELGIISKTKTRRIARCLWLRSLRSPIRFAPTLYIGIGVVLFVPGLLQSPKFARVAIPTMMIFVGAWFSGSAFCLNPLGEEQKLHSLLVLSNTAGAEFMRARMLSGFLVGLPTIYISILVGVSIGAYSIRQTVLLTIIGCVLAAFSACLALGAGTLSPRFERTKPLGNQETVVPSPTAMLVHLFGLGITSLAAFFLVLAPKLSVMLFGVTNDFRLVATVALLAFVALCVAISVGTYMYAVEEFDTYTVS